MMARFIGHSAETKPCPRCKAQGVDNFGHVTPTGAIVCIGRHTISAAEQWCAENLPPAEYRMMVDSGAGEMDYRERRALICDAQAKRDNAYRRIQTADLENTPTYRELTASAYMEAMPPEVGSPEWYKSVPMIDPATGEVVNDD